MKLYINTRVTYFKKVIFNCSLLIIMIVLMSACSTQKDTITAKAAPRISADLLLSKIKSHIDPENLFANLKTLAVEVEYIIIDDSGNRKTILYDYSLINSKPIMHNLNIFTVYSSTGKTIEGESNITEVGDRTIIRKNQGDIVIDIDNQGEVGFHKWLTKSFGHNIFLGLFNDPTNLKKFNGDFYVDNVPCYKISYTLQGRLLDDSNTITLYADKKEYKIRRIITSVSDVKDINYKDFDKIKFIDSFSAKDSLTEKKVSIKIKSIKINIPLERKKYVDDETRKNRGRL